MKKIKQFNFTNYIPEFAHPKLNFVCQYFNIKLYVPDNRTSAWMITTNDKDTFFVFMPGYFSEDDDIHADFELNISNGNLTTFGGI